MNDTAAALHDLTPSLSPEWAVRSFHEERIPPSPPLPDRDLRWRWAVAIIAALLLHISVVTTLDDGFERSKPDTPAPVPVEIVTEQPKPPEPKPIEKPPEQQKPAEPQQPLPYRSSNGELNDKPSGEQPKAETAEKPQPQAAAPTPPAPEPQESAPKTAPMPSLPTASPSEAVPVPLPRETQQAMIAPPVPLKKPPTPPAQRSTSLIAPEAQPAATAKPTTEEDPHLGEGGADKYLRDMKMQVLRNYYYPPTAEMFHMEGTVVYDILLDRSGTVRDVRVIQSAGAVLDRAGYNAIMRGSPYGPLPDYIKADAIVVTMNFPMPVAKP